MNKPTTETRAESYFSSVPFCMSRMSKPGILSFAFFAEGEIHIRRTRGFSPESLVNLELRIKESGDPTLRKRREGWGTLWFLGKGAVPC